MTNSKGVSVPPYNDVIHDIVEWTGLSIKNNLPSFLIVNYANESDKETFIKNLTSLFSNKDWGNYVLRPESLDENEWYKVYKLMAEATENNQINLLTDFPRAPSIAGNISFSKLSPGDISRASTQIDSFSRLSHSTNRLTTSLSS